MPIGWSVLPDDEEFDSLCHLAEWKCRRHSRLTYNQEEPGAGTIENIHVAIASTVVMFRLMIDSNCNLLQRAAGDHGVPCTDLRSE